ncbi:hypothetical protein [Maritimibacter sp.]|uniref:hypothetical protein n=1 Tax=Maritimibacter sp. TaxID=2003363 RepID=UPI00257E16C4|nr:hypothetical protein [Maritimibacter sp.]
MPRRLEMLRSHARETREALEAEYERRIEALGGRWERGRLIFDAEVRRRQRRARQAFAEYVRGIKPLNVITAPVIYSVLIAFVVMDLFVTVYMHVCFPVYGIPKVRRRDHVKVDRHRLPYLNWVQKVNCVYCGYGNGVIAYAREIAARTEAYWCPIKHAERWDGAHDHYAGFMDYGDERDFVSRWADSRSQITGGKRADRPVRVDVNQD